MSAWVSSTLYDVQGEYRLWAKVLGWILSILLAFGFVWLLKLTFYALIEYWQAALALLLVLIALAAFLTRRADIHPGIVWEALRRTRVLAASVVALILTYAAPAIVPSIDESGRATLTLFVLKLLAWSALLFGLGRAVAIVDKLDRQTQQLHRRRARIAERR